MVREHVQSSLVQPALQHSATGVSAHAKPPAPKGSAAQHSEFAQKASKIGLQIHQTTQNLQKLAQLAKRTSMFDDPEQQITELTLVIKQDIQNLNASISQLQGMSHSSWGDGNRQSSVHNEKVVDNLRTRLKDTTQEFKDVLTVRSDNLKANRDRRSLFSSDASKLSGTLATGCLTCHHARLSGNLLARGGLKAGSASLFGKVCDGRNVQ